MRTNTSTQRPLAQLADLLLVQLSNWRWAWRPMVIVGMIAPVTSMFALATFADDPALRAHIMVGTLILGLLFQNQNQVAGNFSFMKENGMLDFFAAQPVNRTLLALATVGAFFLLSLPALVATVVVGATALGIDLSLSPLLLVVVPLCVVPAAGIGALIGSLARSPAESTSTSLMVTFLMTGCGPVLIPAERLPDPIEALGVLNPATYAASALRATLTGPISPHLLLDLAVLTLFTLAVILLVITTMPWRMRR